MAIFIPCNEKILSNDLDYKEIFLSDHPAAMRKKKEYELSKWGCIEFNDVNPGMPSFYCQWIPTEDNMGIRWDGNENENIHFSGIFDGKWIYNF